MTTAHKRTILILTATACCVFGTYVALRVWNNWQVNLVSRAWESAEGAKVGDKFDLKRLSKAWKCNANAERTCSFSMNNWPLPETDFWWKRVAPLYWKVLPISWAVQGVIALDEKGKVRTRNLIVFVTKGAAADFSWGATIDLWDGFKDPFFACSVSAVRHPNYNVAMGPNRWGPVLLVHVSSGASENSRRRASSIDFECLRGGRKCEVSALAPLAWKDYVDDGAWLESHLDYFDNYMKSCEAAPSDK